VEDILRRLGVLESSVTEIRADVGTMRVDVGAMKAHLPHLATKAEISHLEAAMIRWIVGTMIACTAAAFSIARVIS
jgi:hypothetical protein